MVTFSCLKATVRHSVVTLSPWFCRQMQKKVRAGVSLGNKGGECGGGWRRTIESSASPNELLLLLAKEGSLRSWFATALGKIWAMSSPWRCFSRRSSSSLCSAPSMALRCWISITCEKESEVRSENDTAREEETYPLVAVMLPALGIFDLGKHTSDQRDDACKGQDPKGGPPSVRVRILWHDPVLIELVNVHSGLDVVKPHDAPKVDP